MAHRLLAAFVTLTVVVLALGGTERVLLPGSALLQGIQQIHAQSQGSIEDHHLDDLPSQQGADVQKSDSMPFAGLGLQPANAGTASWRLRAQAAGVCTAFIEGLLRPPCGRA